MEVALPRMGHRYPTLVSIAIRSATILIVCGALRSGSSRQFVSVTPKIAALFVEAGVGPRGEMEKDAAVDAEDFKITLRLCADIEGRVGNISVATEKYIDLSYYQRALTAASLSRPSPYSRRDRPRRARRAYGGGICLAPLLATPRLSS